MRGDPRAPRAEAEISTAPPPRREAVASGPPSSRVSAAPKPEVLMRDVTGPRGSEPGAGREALRAFMRSRRLSPTRWAAEAGVPAREILSYLAGRSRDLARETVAKLARAADAEPDDLFR
jgi:hypothetical protein